MDPELKYTQISISQLKQMHPQLMPVIVEEPDNHTYDANNNHTHSHRDSIAIHPACDCNTCCCYSCCGCSELYTPIEMAEYTGRLTLCPITSSVVNNCLGNPESVNDCKQYSCLLAPITMVADLVSLFPRCIIACARRWTMKWQK